MNIKKNLAPSTQIPSPNAVRCAAALLPLLFLLNAGECSSINLEPVPGDTYHGLRDVHKSRVLDPLVGLTLEWNVERRHSGSIRFRISAAKYITRIVIGFTRKGRVDGGDFVVLGRDYNGSPYIYDMHGVGNGTLVHDTRQDWKISTQKDNHHENVISIFRDMETCDNQDLILNEDLTHVVWDYNSHSENNLYHNSDNSLHLPHFVRKGIMPIYLLDPEIPPLSLGNDPGSLWKWTLARTMQVPAKPTTYWCSIQRGPSLSKKHHIVGFAPHFRDGESEKHVHHQVAFRCVPPPGLDAASIFERFADNHPGHDCYLEQNPVLPVHLCRQVIYLWGVGGTDAQLPGDVGFPIGEEENEYYMLETHYDNPEERDDLVVENGVNFYYSPRLRANDGGMTFVSYGIISDPSNSGLFAIPPQKDQFTIAGQCSPRCMTEMLPSRGVEVFVVTLHAHYSAIKMRLRHFRNGRELPLIQREENYDFSFQQMRLLPVPVTILPGDHLVSECVYGTNWKNGSTVSGFSTSDEMCNAFMYLNKRLPYMQCSSEYPSGRISSLFGIRNMTWDITRYERIVTSADYPNLVGLSFSQVVDQIPWTREMRAELERVMLSSEHTASCPSTTTMAVNGMAASSRPSGNVAHPKPYPLYQPASSCPASLSQSTSRLRLPGQKVTVVQPEVGKDLTLTSLDPGYPFPAVAYRF